LGRQGATVSRYVAHEPRWIPARIVIDAEGNTQRGFFCTHDLENGRGPCAATVFSEEQGREHHGCIVKDGDDAATPELPAPLTREAVALAHHRYYCHHTNGRTCTGVDQYDYDFVDLLAEVLALGDFRSVGTP
jgi:hypothetical protein